MSAEPSAGARDNYVPPTQSRRGQLVDSAFILILLFAILFGVTYYSSSTAASDTPTVTPLAELPISDAERAQYQKLIDEELVDLAGANAQVAANAPRPGSDQYPINPLALLLTIAVIGGYLAYVYVMSFREYREVIRERFGPPSGTAPSPRTGGTT
ncbi:MAG: hypothetical protein ACR2JG_14930 [Geodermatophilaceae bacterium]